MTRIIKLLDDTKAIADYIDALKPRIGGLVLYLKDKGEKESCSVDVLRCILWRIETKITTTAKGDELSYVITLIPDVPTFRPHLAELEAGNLASSHAVVNAKIHIHGTTAYNCVFLTYEGVEDAIGDRLGMIDPALMDPPDLSSSTGASALLP